MMNKILNPFEYCSERLLITVGLLSYVLIALYMNATNLMLLSSLKVVFAPADKPWYYSLANLAITLSINVVVLYGYAIVRNVKSRFVDALSTVLIAHIWIYLLVLITGLPFVTKFLKSFELLALDHMDDPTGLPLLPMIGILLFAIFTIGTMVCFFIYLLKGVRIATNKKSVGDSIFVITAVLLVNSLIQFLNPYM